MDFTRRAALLSGAAGALFAGLPQAGFAQGTAIKRGGSITASMDLEPVSLHPLHGNAPGADRYIMNQIFDALLRIEPDGSLTPGLATEWSYGPDNSSIRLKLRENVVFHDGTPFNAEAAKANLDYAKNPKSVAVHTKDLADMTSVEVAGPYEIVLNLSKPSGAMLAALATEPAMMFSPKAIADNPDGYQRQPVGTGPFRFVRWVSGEFIETERNDKYWEQGADGQPLPYLDGLKMRFISNNATKVIEAQGGNLQLADAITPRDADKLKGDARVKLLTPPGGIQSWLAFNCRTAPFDNVHLRRAVVAGIDREGLLKAVALGQGATPPVMFAPNEWAYSDSPAPSAYDPALARDEVLKSGLGPQVRATLNVIQRDPDVQIAQLVQAQLAQVGIMLQVQVLERQAWVQNVIDKNFQIGMGRWAIPYVDPDQICGSVLGRGALNWANIDDADLRALSVEAAQRVDRAERKELYHQIQTRLIDQAYYSFLIMRGVSHLSAPALNGVRFESNGPWYLSGAYLA